MNPIKCPIQGKHCTSLLFVVSPSINSGEPCRTMSGGLIQRIPRVNRIFRINSPCKQSMAQAIKSPLSRSRSQYPAPELPVFNRAQLTLKALEKIKTASECFHLANDMLYLHAPDSIGRYKFAASLERLLGIPATSRNGNTVLKVMEMAQAVEVG